MPTPIFVGSRMIGRTTGLLIRSSGAPSTPTDISLSDSSVDEISGAVAAGTTIGTFSTTGGVAPFSYAITGGAGAAQFTIDGTELKAAVANTLSAGSSPYSIDVQVTDGNSATLSETFSISVVGTVLLETITLDNFSGASRTDPYVTFFRAFEQGQVPTGTKAELRYSGTAVSLQQADGRSYYSDGSLKCARFSAKPAAGAVADGSSFDLTLYKTAGSFSNTTSIARSTLTTQSYRIRLKISGTDYYCLLNNLDAAGTYREIRAGGAVRAWHHWGAFRAGTGGSDTDQGQWQAHFYSYVWSDGTITVFPYAINGRVANGQAYTVDELEFLNGASSVIAHTTDFTAYAHHAYFLCTADGLPHWSANATHFHARTSAAYADDKKLLPHIYSSSTQRAAMSIPSDLSYAPSTPAGDIGAAGINSSGGSMWVGMLPQWSSNAFILADDASISAANRKTMLRNDRVNALAQGVKHPAWFISHTTGLPPNLTNSDFTATGMGAAEPSTGWGTLATITDSGDAYDGDAAAKDPTHQPNYCYHQAITAGWEWWLDFELTRTVGTLGAKNPGDAWYARNPILNSTQRYGGWMFYDAHRGMAWMARNCSNLAWIVPDNHPCKAYADQLITNGNAIAEQFLTDPEYDVDHAVGSSADRSILGVLYTEYVDPPKTWGPWQAGGYFLQAIAMMLRRGQISSSHKLITEHVVKHIVGFYNACPYWAAGAYGCGEYEGSGASGSIIGTTGGGWSNVYMNTSSGIAASQTTKLISDSGGSSGSCPISGTQSTNPYGAGHSYPNLWQCGLEMLAEEGISGASAALTAARAMETAAGISEASWASANLAQWRVRQQ